MPDAKAIFQYPLWGHPDYEAPIEDDETRTPLFEE